MTRTVQTYLEKKKIFIISCEPLYNSENQFSTFAQFWSRIWLLTSFCQNWLSATRLISPHHSSFIQAFHLHVLLAVILCLLLVHWLNIEQCWKLPCLWNVSRNSCKKLCFIYHDVSFGLYSTSCLHYYFQVLLIFIPNNIQYFVTNTLQEAVSIRAVIIIKNISSLNEGNQVCLLRNIFIDWKSMKICDNLWFNTLILYE